VLNSQLSWYAARASGLVAWAIVTLSILWGLALSTRLLRRKGVPAWLLDLHKFLGTLSIVFVAVHVAALVADNFVYFGESRRPTSSSRFS
jgi:predicted ferric reductase